MRTNWLSRIAATLLAAGLLASAAKVAHAAPLNANLVQNPSFESVSGTSANVWTGNLGTFAYSQNYTGAAPVGAGSRYWWGGNGDTVAVTQPAIDLSANAAEIDAGQLNYNLSAFFSGYRQQQDYGTVTATFLNAGAMPISSATVGSLAFLQSLPLGNNGVYADARGWGQSQATSLLPSGTRSVRIDVGAVKQGGLGTAVDGYVDLVDFRLTQPVVTSNLPTEWNFNAAGDRFAASFGPGEMSYHDPAASSWGPTLTQFGTASSLGLPLLPDGNGGVADSGVMVFPKATAVQGYRVEHHATPNGVLGANGKVSNYTMIFDVLYPASSDGHWRSFYQTSTANAEDGELYARDVASGGIGISGQYHGALTSGEWHRVAVVVRSADGEGQMQKYIDGVFVGAQGTTGTAISSRWALDPALLLFTEDSGETDAGFVNSVYFENRLFDYEEIVALGGVNAAGASVAGSPAPPLAIAVPRRAQIISHRGYGSRSNAPENTLVGHAGAWAAGARYIESDIQLTADGVAMVFHDATVDRTTDGSGSIASLSLAQVKALDAGSWAGPQFAGERVPTLREALELSVGKGDLYLDVKVNGPAMVNAIKTAIDQAGVDGSQLLIWNYNHDADTMLYRQLIPNAKIIYEPDLGIVNQSPAAQAQYFDNLQALGVWGFDAGTGNGAIAQAFVDAAHARGFWVATYTILSPEAMQTAILRGVDAMETDFPEYLGQIMPGEGDINLDGVVDRADAAILARNYGRTTGAQWADGNFALPYLNDGAVTLSDLALLQSHLSGSAASSPVGSLASANVPEPGCAVLLGLAGWTLAVVGQVKRRAIYNRRSSRSAPA